MPLTFATLTIGVPGILMSAFPFSEAQRSLGEVLPNAADMVITPRSFCKLPRGTYIFGYDFRVKADKGPTMPGGRICRDVVHGGWVLAREPEVSILF